jgi:allophanate hydrolase
MTTLQIETCQPLVQLQDGGRHGVRHLGITEGGALDWVAQYWANWMLGNALDACVLEIPLGGLSLRCVSDGALALAGADLDAQLDDQPFAPWQATLLRAGQTLRLRQPRQGSRAYLAVPGGFLCRHTLGSAATVSREGLGGLDGQASPLRAGDRLQAAASHGRLRAVPAAQRPSYTDSPVLDLVLGAQAGHFSGQSLFDAFNSDWQLDVRADRMGMRLLGPELQYLGPPMVSEGIPLGAVQVPADGQPIILLNDRQTIGGYPRLGAIAPHSLARLAQCAPGQTVRLRPCEHGGALRQHLQLLEQWKA